MRTIDDPEFKEALHQLLGLKDHDKITTVIPTRVKVFVESDFGMVHVGGLIGTYHNLAYNTYDVELDRREKTS